MNDVKHMAAPCASCSFTRTSTPGALGGSTPEVYIGQTHAPFVLPCHCACNFDDPDWKNKAMSTPQCAGAAIFRANVGMADSMPKAIHKLPADPDKVFATPAEFLAHHNGGNVESAKLALAMCPPYMLARIEVRKLADLIDAQPGLQAARIRTDVNG